MHYSTLQELWAQTHIRWSDAPKHVFTVALWPRCARGWAGRGWTAAGVCWSTWSDRGSCWRRRVRSPPAGRRWWSTSESSRPSRSSSGPPDTRPDCRPGWALTRQHTSVMDLTHCTKYLDTPELSHPPKHTHMVLKVHYPNLHCCDLWTLWNTDLRIIAYNWFSLFILKY